MSDLNIPGETDINSGNLRGIKVSVTACDTKEKLPVFVVCPFLPQTSMSNNMLTIVCVVHGEYRPFPIEIESTKLVGILGAKIKDSIPTWNNIAAKDLDLWKISIPDDDELEAKLKSIKLDGNNADVEKLRAGIPLSDYFSGNNGLVRRNVHVLVQLPVASELYCLPSLRSTD
jgi:hypothetical protein